MGAGFNAELSGADNILLNGAILGFKRKQMLEKAEGIWEFTGLREFADLPLKYYSSGMYMRLAFAIATEVHPDILLVDEALGTGDAAFVDRESADLEPARPFECRRDRVARPRLSASNVYARPLDKAGRNRDGRPDERSRRSLS